MYVSSFLSSSLCEYVFMIAYILVGSQLYGDFDSKYSVSVKRNLSDPALLGTGWEKLSMSGNQY